MSIKSVLAISWAVCGLLFFVPASANAAFPSSDLAGQFANPPASARPWVYWFWLNGNLTKEGITADLEAMQRVGIGGVLIMEVDQGAPAGKAAFGHPEWMELFRFMLKEADRLGLKVNMSNDAGWCGSGGPWITPELSMQRVVWTETVVDGPRRFEGVLPQPKASVNYYEDIATLAMPLPSGTTGFVSDIQGKTSFAVRHQPAQPASFLCIAKEATVQRDAIVDVSAKMDKAGKLAWDAPAGKWLILRMGHTSTGKDNHPAPEPGRGLECDKLSKAAAETHFNGLMGKIITDSHLLTGEERTLVATHIDSWEVGSQNWTPLMREEFKKRRGYDLMPFLPAFTGRVVDSLEVTERFLWDLRQTVSDMIVENYAGHFHTLARRHGMRLSIEAYGEPADDMTYAGQADEPMGEFWSWGKFGAASSCTEMASAAHIYGRRILGAEAFTATDKEKWLGHPALIKDLGDWAFCEGINRFVFHRYAMQPWTKPDRAPGMSMGPWGLHYERTQTWWEQSKAWHQYLARCQYLLQQGLFVSDVCYLQAEGAPRSFSPPPEAFIGGHIRSGYNFDGCTQEVLLTRMTVKDKRLVLPDGMSYRVLVLPHVETMTPALLRKVRELADVGATILGSKPPLKAPGLSDYPKCDEEVARMAGELWKSGKIVTDKTAAELLAGCGVPPDFTSDLKLRFIHRSLPDAEVYFVANPLETPVQTTAKFRIAGKQPELWRADTGEIAMPAAWTEDRAAGHNPQTAISLSLEPRGSVFVVFRKAASDSPIVSAMRNGAPLAEFCPASHDKIVIEKAVYGVPGDPKRTRDVRSSLQAMVDSGTTSFHVAEMAKGGDPAYGIVKTLSVDFTANGKPANATGEDNESIALYGVRAENTTTLSRSTDGKLFLETVDPGQYEMKSASGEKFSCTVPSLPKPVEVAGPWTVRFAPGGGAPAEVTMEKLIGWNEHSNPGVKYFSGSGTYTNRFTLPADFSGRGRRVVLDLGKVAVMAEVKVNGTDLGIQWKEPFRVDVTDCIKPGENTLEVKVVNLWINRLIGDEQLPALPERQANGTLKAWPQWLQNGQPDSTGRFAFSSWNLWKKDSPLQESGLLGPVTLRTVARLEASKSK